MDLCIIFYVLEMLFLPSPYYLDSVLLSNTQLKLIFNILNPVLEYFFTYFYYFI